MANRRFSVGLQYVARSFSGDNPDGLGRMAAIDHGAISPVLYPYNY